MKIVKHNEITSTVFFDSIEERNKDIESLREQGFVRFDPETEINSQIKK